MQINAQPSRRKINKTKKTQQRESTAAAPPLPQMQTHQNAIGRSSHENATQREGPKQKAEEIHASNGTSAGPPRTAIVPYRARVLRRSHFRFRLNAPLLPELRRTATSHSQAPRAALFLQTSVLLFISSFLALRDRSESPSEFVRYTGHVVDHSSDAIASKSNQRRRARTRDRCHLFPALFPAHLSCR